jgi:superfamily II DNA or RNA helicase
MSKLVFKTKPRPHQTPALKFLIKNGGGGLYVPMRYGKTWIAINAAAGLHLKHFAPRILIVCPNDVKEVWEREIELHCPLPYEILEQVTKTKFQDFSRGSLQFHIRNFEGVFAHEWDDPDAVDPETGKRTDRAWSAVSDKNLLEWKPDIVIVDEAHHIGKPTTLTSKKVQQVARMSRFRIFMTGTPWHRKPFYVYGQFQFYGPHVIGLPWSKFKRHIAVYGGYGGYEVKRYKNLKWVRDKIKPHVFIAEKVPSAPPTYKHLRYSLTGKNAAYYRKMEKESIITLSDGATVDADLALTRYLRLAQIAGGWVKLENGRYRRVGTDKKRALQKRIAEYQENELTKLVVGCRFIPELVDVRDAFVAAGYNTYMVHGGVERKDRAVRRDAFNEDDQPAVFITQFRTSREGIDLSSADAMLYYSMPEDYLTYDQFSQRIAKYAEKRTLLYEHLLARGTVEIMAYEAISRQEDVARYIMSRPRLVERLTARV